MGWFFKKKEKKSVTLEVPNVKVKSVTYSTNELGRFNFQIVGTKFVKKKAWSLLKTLNNNDALKLVAESENHYDTDAIAVYFEDTKLGYIPKEIKFEMRQFTDNPVSDYECFFVKASDHEVPFTWVNCYLKK